MATFATAVVTVARTAAVKAVAEGATRAAALNLAIKAGIKQAAIQVIRQMAITSVLPEVLIAAGLDEQQVRKGLLLLDAVPMLLNLRTIHAEMKVTEALGRKVLGADESGHRGTAGNTDPRRRSQFGKGDSSEPSPRTVTRPGDEPTSSRTTDELRVGTIDPIVFGESLGTFSITEPGFAGYPPSIPRPQGPFRVLDGVEYAAARRAANRVNQELRKAEPSKYAGHEIHEIQPVKFGGSPTDSANKIPVPTEIHRTQVTPWWNRFQRELNKTLRDSK